MILYWFTDVSYWLLKSKDNTIIAGQIYQRINTQTKEICFQAFRTLKPYQVDKFCSQKVQYNNTAIFKTLEECKEFVEQAAAQFYIILNDKQINLL